MISRVAESCFWMNRYVERIESLARLVHVNLAFQLDVKLPDAERWRPLLVVTGQEADFVERIGAARSDRERDVLDYLTWDRENPSSIWSSLYWARENARTVRETVSLELFETLNGLWLWLGSRPARGLYQRSPYDFYVHLRDECVRYQGFALSTMLLEEPFDFMRLGTALERAGQTARILDVKYHSLGPTDPTLEMPAEAAQWLAILRSCSAIEPFFKRSGDTLSGRAVAGFLLLERAFPRSVLHNLDRARNFLDRIRAPGVGETSFALLAEQLAELEGTNVDRVLGEGLHEVLTRVVDGIAGICDAVQRDYFDPGPQPPTRIATPTQSQSQS